jgi:hypothetical protein
MNLLVATRKGLFQLSTQRNSRARSGHPLRVNVERHDFPGDALSQVLVDPRDGCWYAAQNLGHFGVKLKRSVDRGLHWLDMNAPTFPAKPQAGPWADDPTPWNVEQLWSLSAGGADCPGELWAGCLPAGLFHSMDFGQSWRLIEPLWLNEARREWFGGGYDHAGIHTILVDPRDPRCISIAISCGGIWKSLDRGASWRLIGEGQTADFLPSEQANNLNQQDPHCLAACAAYPDVQWIQHHGGQYRSSDGGEHFERLQQGSGQDFGFAVAADPINPMRAWFVPAVADAKRFPKHGALAVLRTDDGGKTFKTFTEGLPSQHCYDLVYRHGLIVDSTGKRLAMASSTGHLWLSENAGKRWQVVPMLLPPIYALAFC